VPGGPLGAEPAGDLLLGFAGGTLGLAWFEWAVSQVGQEPEHVVLVAAQACQRYPGGRLRGSGIRLAQLLASRLQDGG
jgi:hypothetical protein